ncbi:nucleotide-binding universal stress UspA family protein [Actinoplanes tereljensis]|uniref:Universal stress protein A n=1 Tax=Paractinoplanes tereljensis TaxID=571912 RepID=A0A919NYB0_9ACTN|nr:universal stress protein [Actinoplanes tereljensis]GIF26593.1 universal stress protein A [Actinoplanes tereljensis]
MDGPSAILVGVDGSATSMRAAAYAVGLARRQRCKLVAVYVRSLPSAIMPLADLGGGATTTLIATHDDVEKELRASIGLCAEMAVDARLVVRTGEPYAELLDVAREIQADAVIVGRSAQALHRFAGSLATKLVRCGRWPVTVVP